MEDTMHDDLIARNKTKNPKTTTIAPNNSLVDLFTISVKPSKPSRPIARIIDSNVTTDSVVATLTVVTNAATRRITVRWGDGNTDIINQPPGAFMGNQLITSGNNLAPGTFQFYHVYEPSENEASKKYPIFIKTNEANGSTDSDFHEIEIVPRYKVTLYPLSVRLKHACDNEAFFGNGESEFLIRQYIGGDLVNSWNDWTPSNSFFINSSAGNYRLEGSQISREFSRLPSSNYLNVRYEFEEIDDIYNDEIHINARLGIDQSAFTKNVTRIIEGEENRDGCTIIYSYTKEISLIVSLPNGNSPVFTTEVFV